MNKFIARFTIFYCTIFFGIVLYNAWNGELFFNDIYKSLLGYCLYLLSKEHPKYNCKYARFLALNISFTELFTYVDDKFNLVEDVECYLYILSASWILAVSATIYLAIRHFIKVRSLRREKNRYEEFKLK